MMYGELNARQTGGHSVNLTPNLHLSFFVRIFETFMIWHAFTLSRLLWHI